MIEAGAVVKLTDTDINVGSPSASSTGSDYSLGAMQVLGTPQDSVYFTSYNDASMGGSSNPINSTPKPGDWGGLVFENDQDYAAASPSRVVLETQGIFLDYVNHAAITYGGGQTPDLSGSGQLTYYDPIHLIDARPTVTFNTITQSQHAAISGDPNTFEQSEFYGQVVSTAYTLGHVPAPNGNSNALVSGALDYGTASYPFTIDNTGKINWPTVPLGLVTLGSDASLFNPSTGAMTLNWQDGAPTSSKIVVSYQYSASAIKVTGESDAGTAVGSQVEYTNDYDREGPLVQGNVVANDVINGMLVRIRTNAGQPIDTLTVPAVFASTDITYVITENLYIVGQVGGPLNDGDAPGPTTSPSRAGSRSTRGWW